MINPDSPEFKQGYDVPCVFLGFCGLLRPPENIDINLIDILDYILR